MKLQPKAKWVRFEHPLGGNWFRWGDTKICVECHGGLWHISISCRNRYPTWEEIKAAWYDLIPGAGKDFEGAIILPRTKDYVNFDANCFHVHQLLDTEIPAGIIPVSSDWRNQPMTDQPSQPSDPSGTPPNPPPANPQQQQEDKELTDFLVKEHGHSQQTAEQELRRDREGVKRRKKQHEQQHHRQPG